jgi:hypothetical protein
MVSFANYDLPFSSSNMIINDDDIFDVSIVLFLGYSAFVLGYRLLTPRLFVDRILDYAHAEGARRRDDGSRTLVVLFFSLLLVCAVFFSRDLASVFSGYEGKIEARYGASNFALLYSLTLTTLVTYISFRVLYYRDYKRTVPISVGALFILSLVTYSKEPMVYGAIVLFAAAARAAPRIQTIVFVASIGVATILLIYAIPAFSMYRDTGTLVFVNPHDVSLGYLFSDARGPFGALVLAVRGHAPVRLGPLYESFFLWIPRGLWPSRPLDASEDFARAVMANWQPGFGLGFSPFAEAMIRLGVFLSPLLLFISGFVVSGLQRLALRLTVPSVAPALLLVVQGYIMFTIHRGPFSGIFTAMAQFWVPFLFLATLLRFALRRKTRQVRL